MTSFTRVSIQWGHDDPTMEPSLAGEKELSEVVFLRDLWEITSHARVSWHGPLPKLEGWKIVRCRRREISRARACECQSTGTAWSERKTKNAWRSYCRPRRKVVPFSQHIRQWERVYSVSYPFSTFVSSIFLAPSVRPSVRSPPARKKQLKRLKSPKAWREAKRDRKAFREFFARSAPRVGRSPPSGPGYCDSRWNCPGQLRWNLTSIRTYYLNRGSAPASGSLFFSCSFRRRHVMRRDRSTVKRFAIKILNLRDLLKWNSITSKATKIKISENFNLNNFQMYAWKISVYIIHYYTNPNKRNIAIITFHVSKNKRSVHV